MGCSSSCNIFTQFSQALQWAAYTKMGINNIVFILDDFLFINSSYQSCHSDLYKFINMCQDIGVPIAHNKTFQPSQVLSFLGIELDALHAEARLPQDKLDKCINSVQAALSKSKLTLRQLQSLIGLLNFACQVVSPGRAFLRRLINLTLGKSNPYHKVRLNVQAKCDLRAWLFFLQSFNGRCFFHDDPWQPNQSLHLYSDASKLGFGAVFGNRWLYGAFPPTWQQFDIWILELYALVAAFVTWKQSLQDKKVAFHCDSLNA
jgi:hypothetical protein